MTPEAAARQKIDEQLVTCGWILQNHCHLPQVERPSYGDNVEQLTFLLFLNMARSEF